MREDWSRLSRTDGKWKLNVGERTSSVELVGPFHFVHIECAAQMRAKEGG